MTSFQLMLQLAAGLTFFTYFGAFSVTSPKKKRPVNMVAVMILAKHSLGTRCRRCRQNTINEACKATGIDTNSIEAHAIDTSSALTEDQELQLQERLRDHGIELIVSQRDMLVERIKGTIAELVEPSDHLRKQSLVHYLQEKLCYSYSHLSKVFTESVGASPEHYFLELKIGRVEDLLLHGMRLTDIAYRLNYSSVAHLSHQFRRVTEQSAREWMRTVHVETSTEQLTLGFENTCNTFVNSCNDSIALVS